MSLTNTGKVRFSWCDQFVLQSPLMNLTSVQSTVRLIGDGPHPGNEPAISHVKKQAVGVSCSCTVRPPKGLIPRMAVLQEKKEGSAHHDLPRV